MIHSGIFATMTEKTGMRQPESFFSPVREKQPYPERNEQHRGEQVKSCLNTWPFPQGIGNR